MSTGRVHTGVVAHVDSIPGWTTKALLDDLFDRGESPFLVLADGLSYEHNLGAILRTCLGFGVNGLILPTHRGASVSSVVQRVSMGAVEEVPIVHEGLFSALKHIKKAGIQIIGADMNGVSMTELRMSGAIAIVMGAEGSGLSSKLRERCTHIASIPLVGGLESLNVSVAAAVLMYEKRRQDGWF
jgi:23S rRNA (guanosine2251-2'-O)-methyltransferase